MAIENGLKHIPRDAQGQWNAEEIFKSLKSKNLMILPSPSRLRPATLQEQQGITVVIGWDRTDASLLLEVQTPGGTTITAGSAGVVAATGRTWAFLRIPLPFGSERDGTWSVTVYRPGGVNFLLQPISCAISSMSFPVAAPGFCVQMITSAITRVMRSTQWFY